jgi:hypothetical protein
MGEEVLNKAGFVGERNRRVKASVQGETNVR